jgi:hypothetical protein
MMYEAAAEASPTANPNVIIERRRQITVNLPFPVTSYM